MKQLFKFLLMVCVASSTLYSQEIKDGSLSVLVFSDGKPLVANEIKIDANKILKTDGDGAIQTRLHVGSHQIEIFGKDSDGINLGYFKKQVRIEKGKDTQVIATLSKTAADSIDIDAPVAVSANEAIKEVAATGTGRLRGRVLSSQGNKPIEGARVFVRGTAIDIRTDANGQFSATVPSGKPLSISVVHSAYSAQTVGGFSVKANAIVSKTVKLTPASMELEEFVVLAPKVEGSIADVIAEEKKSSAVTNILGSEEMSKKGDSDAASALKRVTGVTLIGGKSIYVRGLGDRYSNIEMNSLPLPSPDPTKRVVPLDIFPSGVISSMKVQKSGTADIPASFGGGYVDIRTKESANDDYIKLSLGLKGNSNTGKSVINYKGSSTDWMGFDDGYRAIDQSILDEIAIVVGESPLSFTTRYYTKEELSSFVQKYIGDRNYDIENKSLPLGGSMGGEISKHYDIDEENKITVFGNYGYKQEHNYREEAIASYDIDQSVPSDNPDYDPNNPDAQPEFIYTNLNELPSSTGKLQRSSSEYSQSGIFNIGYSFSDVLNLKYTKLYTHNALKSTAISIGTFGSNPTELFFYNDLQWEERTLNTDQFNGDFDYELFDKKNEFKFGYEIATAKLSQPNNFRYIYIDDDGIDTGRLPYLQKTSNQFAKRLSSQDDLDALYLKNKLYPEFFSDEDFIELGYSQSNKKRKSLSDEMLIGINGDETVFTDTIETIYDEYVRPDIPYDDRRMLLQNNTQAKNYFDASVRDVNSYVSLYVKPRDDLDILIGARQANVEQITTEYYLYNRSYHPGEEYDATKNNTYQKYDRLLELNNELFPSASLKYKLNKDNIVDAAYAKTYILPDLREASSGRYSHPYEIADIQGNPDLTYTIINSYDIKYSHYFSSTENMKVGIFYKTLDNPIEDTQLPSSSLPIYSFQNSQKATMYGIELDGRKNLDFIHTSMSNYYVSGNFTYTYSDVTVTPEQAKVLSTNHRQLQGLSPTVINLAFSYEKSDRSITLAYNKMGARIRKLGMRDANLINPDYMENPAAVLDAVWIEKFDNDFNLKMKLGNLLDGDTIWYQQDIDHATKKFKKGMNASISVSYKY